MSRLVIFDYQKGHSRDGPADFLEGFEGALQTDGYKVYTSFDRLDKITQYCCWAHARRYFHWARHLHPKYSEAALHLIGELYKIERELREGDASNEECVETEVCSGSGGVKDFSGSSTPPSTERESGP